MLKNKIISIISTIAVLFSFATVAHAEKEPFITNPTFFIEDVGYVEDLEMYAYAVGLTYDEFTVEDNPFTYTRTGASAATYKYSGVGIGLMNFKLSGFPMAEGMMILSPDYAIEINLELNGLINYQYGNSCKALLTPDVGTFSETGAVFCLICSETEVDVDVNNVTTSDVTLFVVDTGTTATKTPSEVETWTYSSDPSMIEAGNAEFIAYTAPQSADAVNSVTIKNGGADAGDEITAKLGDDDITLSADVDVTGNAATTVNWTTSADSVATVADGVVTIKGVGTATITATSTADDTKKDSVNIVVTLPDVTGVTLNKNELSLDVYNNQTATLIADVSPDLANQEVTWESDDEDVATVDGGVVTAVGVGSATITVKSVADPSKSATCAVTVTDSTPIIPDEFDGVITHEDYDGVPEGKMIVTHSTYVTGVDADTRVSVSYNGEAARVFGTTLGEYLQLNSGITFEAKIRFGVLCDDDLDADAFAFIIQ